MNPPKPPMRKQVTPRPGDPVDRLTMPEARHLIKSMQLWQDHMNMEYATLDRANHQLDKKYLSLFEEMEAKNHQIEAMKTTFAAQVAALEQTGRELAAMVVDLEKRNEACCAHNLELKAALTASMQREENLRLEIARLNARMIIITSIEDLCK